MLKMIKDQSKVESIKNAIEKKSNQFSSFNAGFTEDDTRYNKNEKALILAIVNQGKLSIKLGIDNNGLDIKDNIHSFTDEEIKGIKIHLTAY